MVPHDLGRKLLEISCASLSSSARSQRRQSAKHTPYACITLTAAPDGRPNRELTDITSAVRRQALPHAALDHLGCSTSSLPLALGSAACGRRRDLLLLLLRTNVTFRSAAFGPTKTRPARVFRLTRRRVCNTRYRLVLTVWARYIVRGELGSNCTK